MKTSTLLAGFAAWAILGSSAPARANTWRGVGPTGGATGPAVVDPADSSSVFVSSGAGLFGSHDGGSSWVLLANGLPATAIVQVVLSASTGAGRNAGPRSAYAIVGTTVYRSIDGGTSWQVATPIGTPISEIAVDPTDSQIVYARTANLTTCAGEVDSILKTVDGGLTWIGTGANNLAIQFNEGFCQRALSDLVVDPGNPHLILAGGYRSFDGGSTWEFIVPPITNPFFPIISRNWTYTDQGYYRVNVANDSFVGSLEMSRDGGVTWQPFAADMFGDTAGKVWADPHNRVVYVSSTGGLFYSTDAGETWVPDPPATCSTASLTLDPSAPSTLYLGAACKSVDFGQTWVALPDSGLQGNFSERIQPFVSFSQPDTVYAPGYSQLHVSTDGATTWTTRSFPTGFAANKVAIDPSADQIIYAMDGPPLAFTATGGLLRSDDYGASWMPLTVNLPCGAPTTGLSAAVGPNDSTLFLSASREPNTTSAPAACFGVMKSVDQGASWTSVSTLHVDAIVTHPTDASIVFLVGVRQDNLGTTTPVLQRSSDGGSTFQTIAGAPELTTLVIDPLHAGVLYGASGQTIYTSVDNGDTWQQLGTILDNPVQAPAPYSGWDGLGGLGVDFASGTVFVATATAGGTPVQTLMLPAGQTAWVDLLGPGVWTLAVAPLATTTLFGGTLSTGVWSTYPFVATVPPPTLSASATSGGVSLAATITAGATVFLEATASGVSAPIYRFSRWDPLVGWRLVRDYTADPSYSWTPGATDTGAHSFQVAVRTLGDSTDAATTSITVFSVVSASISVAPSNLVTRSAPQDLEYLLIDYNADGVKDVFVHNRASGDWAIYDGTADGTFVEAASGGWAPGWTIQVADFNGDGFSDFFLYSKDTGVFYKVINTGTGFQYFTQGWRPGFDVYVLDLNGDHKSDVFVIDPRDGTWYTCISTGDGTQGFAYAQGQWAPGWNISVGDFDGDGSSDLFLYNPATGADYKARSDGDGGFEYDSGQGPPLMAATIMDLNGDGHSDVLFYDVLGGAFQRCTSIGDGMEGFSCDAGGWLPGFSIYPAKFDTGPRSDLFLDQPSSGAWYKVVNGVDGFSYASGGWAQWSIAVADLDGDGRSDVFLFDPASGVYYEALTDFASTFVYKSGVIQ